MLNLSDVEIGIENPAFYLPARSYPLHQYLAQEPQEFTFQRMKRMWRESYFESEFYYRFLSEQVATWGRRSRTPDGDGTDRLVAGSGIERIHVASDETTS